MQEVWKDVKGYEGLYMVSNIGNVMSLERKVNSTVGKDGKRTLKPRILKPNKRSGYNYVPLSRENFKKNYAVHRLVAEHFIKPIPENFVINHIDHDRTNNLVENLEIVTQKQNIQHSAYKMHKMKTKNPSKTATGEPYIVLRHRKKKIKYRVRFNRKETSFDSLKEAIIFRDSELKRLGVILYE